LVWTTTARPFLTVICFFASAGLGRANKHNKSKLHLSGEAIVCIARKIERPMT